MQDIKVHFQDYSFVRVECSTAISLELGDYFSFEVEGARFSNRYKYGGWNGKIKLFTYENNLPFGLVSTLRLFAKQMEYSIWVDPRIHEKEDITKEQFEEWVNGLTITSGGNKITPHWYQTLAAFEGIHHRRRILNMPTSSGKSLTQCIMSRWYLENYEGKVLIIVPTTSLVLQMRDDFVDYSLFPYEAIHTITGGKSKDTGDRLICVSTWQSACKQPIEWFQQFGMVMVDECHLATAKNLTKIVTDMTHCKFKFGLSGSLRDGKANLLQYVGMFGDISRPVSVHKLMEDGQVTNLKINCLFMRYTDEECAAMKGKDYADEIKFITSHKKRNAYACKLALNLAKQKEQNVFLMYKNKKHGKWMYDALCKQHDKVYYVDGDVDTNTRDELKKMAEGMTGMIVVASYGVFSTGVSIKNLHHVIFAHPTKSGITVRQSIGRALRKHGSKSIATIWDIIDHLAVKTKSKNAKKQFSHLNYTLKHALERVKIYNEDRFEYATKTIEL
ncbi:DEAD/DEAH box helicase [Salmonella enterica]|nr:DEAD/DEAH box helicase [Salmonella enterica]EHO5591409.1 DEAD/DEAH box helicase family protein [Salmonella enterica]EHO5708867.1 DEAD/DEAH box helicase family protein [Salmonella enterica]